ncbi:MAG: DNA-processing protein DprA [Clostridia bacterium]|nr:DNA-processing protein DprA [Clostridia bacterium]
MSYTEEQALIWLCGCTPFDYRERMQLLRTAPSPKALFEDFEKFSAVLIKKGESGVYNKQRGMREADLARLLADMERTNRFAITVLDSDYPESLKAIPEPPFVLFGEGNRSLLSKRKFCIVGSRITPAWAEKVGKQISAELAEHFVIVTGLAEGGDSAAVSGAIESGNLICVLPTGLDTCYPASHASLKARVAKSGLVLSEYPMREGAKKYSFHARNRILAGLSEGVFVLSAGAKSGTLITANAALDYGRDVFALPHNVGVAQGAGCNALIQKGAYLVTCTEDILTNYGIQSTRRETVTLPPEEEKMLCVLRESGEAHVAELADKAGMKIYEAAAVLSALELKNLAVKSGGNKYAAV